MKAQQSPVVFEWNGPAKGPECNYRNRSLVYIPKEICTLHYLLKPLIINMTTIFLLLSNIYTHIVFYSILFHKRCGLQNNYFGIIGASILNTRDIRTRTIIPSNGNPQNNL